MMNKTASKKMWTLGLRAETRIGYVCFLIFILLLRFHTFIGLHGIVLRIILGALSSTAIVFLMVGIVRTWQDNKSKKGMAR